MAAGNGNTMTPDQLGQLIDIAYIDEELEKVAEPLKALEARMLGQRAKLIEAREGIDNRLQGVRATIKRLDPSYAASAPSPSKRKKQPGRVGKPQMNGTATGFGVTIEAAAQGADKIKELVAAKEADDKEPVVTQREVYHALHWEQGKGSQLFRYLRSIEFLRNAGRDPSSKAILWAIMDGDAVDRALAEAERADQAELEAVA